MSEVVTYKNAGVDGCFCQIKLDSGERVLISIAQPGIELFELDQAGVVPIKTLVSWDIVDIGSAIQIFADLGFPEKPPLDAIKDRILKCRSIVELLQLCGQA